MRSIAPKAIGLAGPNFASGSAGFWIDSYPIVLNPRGQKAGDLPIQLASLLSGYRIDETSGHALVIAPEERYKAIQELRIRYRISAGEDILKGLISFLSPKK